VASRHPAKLRKFDYNKVKEYINGQEVLGLSEMMQTSDGFFDGRRRKRTTICYFCEKCFLWPRGRAIHCIKKHFD